MTGYSQFNLFEILAQIGEDRTKTILADFSCPLNCDVEEFLKLKAIEFAKQKIASNRYLKKQQKNSKMEKCR